jgi:small-conductance mechanosensitive channel
VPAADNRRRPATGGESPFEEARMNWTTDLDRVLHYRIFEMAGQAITPIQLVMLTVVFFVTLYGARTVRRLFELQKLRHFEPGPRYTFARLTQYVIWLLGIMVGLKVLNINLTAIAVVAGALGVGVGFGLQNIVANFFAGLVLLFERPIKVSDRITVDNVDGNVVEIKFRSTTIVTNDNIAIIVPNSRFINQTVINWSYGDPRVRLHVPIGVSYGSDPDLVTSALLEVAAGIEGVLKDPPPSVRFLAFADSSLNFELLVWTDQPARHFWLHSHINYAIAAAFKRKGIEVPFPQRDLHIKSAEGSSALQGTRTA